MYVCTHANIHIKQDLVIVLHNTCTFAQLLCEAIDGYKARQSVVTVGLSAHY